MSTKIILSFLIGGMVVALITPTKAAGEWLGIGTVTKTDGSTFQFIGANYKMYTVDAVRSALLFENFSADCSSIHAGDKVRVYGHVAGPYQISAVRVRVFRRPAAVAAATPEEPIVKIVMENTPTPQPAAMAAGPLDDAACEALPETSATEVRGLINDIDYTRRLLKIQTSTGLYSVSVNKAPIVRNGRRIGFGLLNQGDAVTVCGNLICANQVECTNVRVDRSRTDAENVNSGKPLTYLGVIQQVDYPSMTFKMQGYGPIVVVSADGNTAIEHQNCGLDFMALRPGMRVKMTGNGSLNSGYAANKIIVIGMAP